MAKTRIEKIEGITEEIRQLRNRQKLLQQQHNAQERKARVHRFCRRMGLFESLIPDTIALNDEQFKTFLEKTVANDYGRKTLSVIMEHDDGGAAPVQATTENGVATDEVVGNDSGILRAG